MSEQDQNTTPGYSNQRLTKDQQDQLLFMMLVQQHEQICMMGLGKLKNPGTDKVERDLGSAKYAIDTLEMLQRYTKNNLPDEVNNYLEQTLTNLRLNYVDESSADKKEKQKDETAENSSEKGDQE
jgi:hypothetical protein